ncbi:MAG: radical SAM protein [Phycisphaerae bacterium]|nr:radical SAM protein [Phycisphaerae bacterium]
MRVLLLSPPYLPDYMRNARCDFVSLSASQWYPLWLGYAGAWLEHCGHEVKLVDAPSSHLDHDATTRIVTEWQPDMLVVYTGQKSRTNDVEIADRLTEKLDCISVLVGPQFSSSPEETLRQARAVAYGVEGEFDYALAELAAGNQPASIRNLLYRDGDTIAHNAQRPYLTGEQLDQFPFVTRFFRNHLDIRNYKTISEFHPFIDLMTGRGCAWGQCTFCLWVHTFVRGKTYNLRSIENVLEELRCVEQDMPEVRSVMVQDDTLTDERAAELSALKTARKIKIPWSCYARGNLSLETMKLMKKANCRNLHVGYESGDPQILKNIRKGVSIKTMEEFTANAKRAGLRIHADFAIGFPGETAQTAERTIRWAKRLNPDTVQFQLANVMEGTPFHTACRADGWLTENGEPDYPNFSNGEIRAAAKHAYRTFYLSWQWGVKCLRHPYENFFSRLNTMSVALPAMFWKRW